MVASFSQETVFVNQVDAEVVNIDISTCFIVQLTNLYFSQVTHTYG